MSRVSLRHGQSVFSALNSFTCSFTVSSSKRNSILSFRHSNYSGAGSATSQGTTISDCTLHGEVISTGLGSGNRINNGGGHTQSDVSFLYKYSHVQSEAETAKS